MKPSSPPHPPLHLLTPGSRGGSTFSLESLSFSYVIFRGGDGLRVRSGVLRLLAREGRALCREEDSHGAEPSLPLPELIRPKTFPSHTPPRGQQRRGNQLGLPGLKVSACSGDLLTFPTAASNISGRVWDTARSWSSRETPKAVSRHWMATGYEKTGH